MTLKIFMEKLSKARIGKGREGEGDEKGYGWQSPAPFQVIVAACRLCAISFAIIEYIAPPAGLRFEWNSRNGTGNWHLALVPVGQGCLFVVIR